MTRIGGWVDHSNADGTKEVVTLDFGMVPIHSNRIEPAVSDIGVNYLHETSLWTQLSLFEEDPA